MDPLFYNNSHIANNRFFQKPPRAFLVRGTLNFWVVSFLIDPEIFCVLSVSIALVIDKIQNPSSSIFFSECKNLLNLNLKPLFFDLSTAHTSY